MSQHFFFHVLFVALEELFFIKPQFQCILPVQTSSADFRFQLFLSPQAN